MTNKEQHSIRVYFENGAEIITTVNGTVREITDYYKLGKKFNVSLNSEDVISKVSALQFRNKPVCWVCGVDLKPNEMRREQCLSCFRDEDGPYCDDYKEENYCNG